MEMDEPQQENATAEHPEDESSEGQMRWYVLKIQSNREKSIKEALERAIRREGMQDDFGEIVIPTEKIVETRGGKKKVITRKLYPGYIMIQMVLNDDTWYLVRGTNGVGDFTGAAGKPLPMSEEEIDTMLRRKSGVDIEPAKVRIELAPGEMVKIKEGGFESFEGTIDAVDEGSGKVTVLVEVFGRPVPVELEHSQVERI
jgi:transcriptional antiterminator NusG